MSLIDNNLLYGRIYPRLGAREASTNTPALAHGTPPTIGDCVMKSATADTPWVSLMLVLVGFMLLSLSGNRLIPSSGVWTTVHTVPEVHSGGNVVHEAESKPCIGKRGENYMLKVLTSTVSDKYPSRLNANDSDQGDEKCNTSVVSIRLPLWVVPISTIA